MNKIIFLLAALFSVCNASFAQVSNEKMLFVIDSVPLITNPEEWNEILDTDIADMAVIKDKDSLKLSGLSKYEGVTYIFTKGYRNRPDSIKKIPSLKQMKMENDVWSFENIPYSGKYIDYYNSGRKQNEGTLLNGKLNGQLKIYYQNGNVGSAYNYKDGIKDGISYEYYRNGALSQLRTFKNGRDDGVWENYFPGGKPGHHGIVKNGKLGDSVINYFSTGKVNKTVINNSSKGNIDYLMNEIYQSQRAGNTKSVIKICSKIIKIDSEYFNAYFYKGLAMLDQFQFDEAIEQFDKALSIEPLFTAALTYRAMTHIRKYEYQNSRILSKNEELTVVASKQKSPMPEEIREKICIDLMKIDSFQTLYGYGDRNLQFITGSLLKYCNLDIRR